MGDVIMCSARNHPFAKWRRYLDGLMGLFFSIFFFNFFVPLFLVNFVVEGLVNNEWFAYGRLGDILLVEKVFGEFSYFNYNVLILMGFSGGFLSAALLLYSLSKLLYFVSNKFSVSDFSGYELFLRDLKIQLLPPGLLALVLLGVYYFLSWEYLLDIYFPFGFFSYTFAGFIMSSCLVFIYRARRIKHKISFGIYDKE